MTLPVVHSQRIGADLQLGLVHKPAPSPESYFKDFEKVAMREILKVIPSDQLPTVPENFGHGLAFGETGWGMDGNGPKQPGSKIPAAWAASAGAGNCFWAGAAHDIREKALVNGHPVPAISDLTTIQNYAKAEGYNPQTGAGDNGTDPVQGLAWRQKEGFVDDNGVVHVIGTIVECEAGNLTEMFYAAWLCEAAGVGFNFQTAQMDQFDNGEPFAYVQGSSIEGGHWVITTSRNGLITWGARQGYLDSWFTNLCSCAYGWYDLLEYNAKTGESAEHFSDTDVEKYMTIAAAQKAQAIGLS